MVKRILKKDLKRRKSINIILFLFVFLASVFLSSSTNNILVVGSAVNYYLDYANVPDINFIINGEDEKEIVDTWMKESAPDVRSSTSNKMISIASKSIKYNDSDESLFESIADLYLGTMDSEYCKVFDADGEELILEKGEIGITRFLLDKTELNIGDKITIKAGNTEKEYMISQVIKDAAYGSEMMGMSRMILNEEDFTSLLEDEENSVLNIYYVESGNPEKFSSALDSKGFSSLVTTVSKSMYKMVFAFDMIIAALLITIGICLILIALLVLRFTLVFTMEEDYREIGIMKAIGIKNFAIQKLYLLKYLVLVTAGAVLGLAVSVPVSSVMVDSVSKNMIMESSKANLWVNILCTALIILMVMLFCYGCTRKLRKISAIAAINGGHIGIRYRKKNILRLSTKKRMAVPVFLGLNDMMSNLRRYMVLMITFCISFILIAIPLNTLNTMRSQEMAQRFLMDPDSAVYVNDIESKGEGSYHSIKDLEKGMVRLEQEMKELGYDPTLTALPIIFMRYGDIGSDIRKNILTVQAFGKENQFLTYEEGRSPKLVNEIAFSIQVMKERGWQIGDSIEATLGTEKDTLIITGIYSDYMQMGQSARINPEYDLQNAYMFDYWNIMVNMDTDKTQQEVAAELRKKLPNYEWSDAQANVDKNVGGIQKTLESMLLPMTGMLCAVIMLITFLMERLFVVREKGEIAMMKSVGFKNRTIRLWQIFRIVCVALFSMVAAIPLSLLSNEFILKPIFAIMGAKLTIQVVPWQVYGAYPGILLIGIILATSLAAWNIKKIHIRELNNLE